LSQLAKRQIDAALSKALDENDQYFQREREKLDKWAEDQVLSAEIQLEDTKIKIRDAKKQARTAQTLEEQKAAQERIQQLERQQRRQRQSIFDVEDAIEAKRDLLIDGLEKQMHKTSTTHRLFTIRWRLV
jgi:predicted  nucleic acid-binding Zn-ribbon protein